MADTIPETAALPVTINKYAVIPSDIAWVPRGKVLHAGFVGKIAYVWIMHHPDAPVDAQILTVPSETVIALETDPLFHPPEHVGSFFVTDASKLLPSCWHSFLFMPRANGSILLAN